MTESKFQSKLVKKLEGLFPGCLILKNDADYLQGVPDLLILFERCWASLECKRDPSSPHRPNQDYYVRKMDEMSFSRFIHPDNQKEVLDELEQFFKRQSHKVSKGHT